MRNLRAAAAAAGLTIEQFCVEFGPVGDTTAVVAPEPASTTTEVPAPPDESIEPDKPDEPDK